MILYFSGTGNSRYVAQRIAEALGDELLSMNDRIKAGDTSPVASGERLVIVTPTYAWRIPRIVRDWLAETDFPCGSQAWFVMTCGSEIGNAAQYNRALCQEKQLTYMGTAQIVMPENYIAMFNALQAAVVTVPRLKLVKEAGRQYTKTGTIDAGLLALRRDRDRRIGQRRIERP